MKRIIAFIAFLAVSVSTFATHNRAGEITYVRISDLTYKFTVVTYTKESSEADRCELEIQWGDGSLDTIARLNGPSEGACRHAGELLDNDVKKNIYEGYHTFPGPGSYRVSVIDANRNANVINIPNSVSVPFYVQTTLIISPFLGENTSPLLLNPPIDDACACKKFIHNPGAWDADGDSISYSLVNSKGEGGADISGYYIPNGVTLNAVTGDLVWNCPNPMGEFNFAILIKEWRSGVVIGSIIRDMQVTVSGSCINNPPVIQNLKNICVEADTRIEFDVTATDVDMNRITLTSTGGPYFVSNPAYFVGDEAISSVTGRFTWQTACNHVRVQPYSVTFKAEDAGNPNLADLKTIDITVVGPAPKNLSASPSGNTIQLSWSASRCSQAIGYRIYRRNGPSNWIHGECETGIPAYTGYTMIGEVEGLNNTSFTDNNKGAGLIHGEDYCYMIYAIYPDGAKSYASNEACTQLKKDVPIITHVSVFNTAKTNGGDTIIWSKPTEIDLTQGPFKYMIYRSADMTGSNFKYLATLDGLHDTDFVDNDPLLNTEDNPNSYRIDLYKQDNIFVGSTRTASSVYLTLTPSDNQMQLSWQENVPWRNYMYYIYRQDPGATDFVLIDSTTAKTYANKGLLNNTEYCYYVKSKGEYTAPGIIKPIINFSQRACGQPKDLTAPCPPVLNVKGDCNAVLNTLIWNNPNHSCADDVVKYKLYYKPTSDTLLQMTHIATISNPNDTTYTHSFNGSIAGCYAIAAVDSFENESIFSNIACVDNCPNYTLPNVFTPDGDGINDRFHPLPYKFVESVDMKIFNRWGQIVFETTNPDILWDGINKDSKKLVPEGVYFYSCIVNEIRLVGIVPRQLNGFIHLFTGTSNGTAQ